MRTVQNTSSNANSLREAWVDDLLYRYPWHEFATCTFKYPQHDETRAIAMFTKWVNGRWLDHAVKVGDARVTRKPKLKGGVPVYDLVSQWDRDEGCYVDVRVPIVFTSYSGPFLNRWRRHPEIRPVWVVGIEQHRNGSNHIHALIHHRWYQGEISRRDGWDSWHNQLAYGRMRLEPPQSDEDVRGYLSKYVCKAGSIELSPSFTAASLTTSGVSFGRPSTTKAGPQSPSAG